MSTTVESQHIQKRKGNVRQEQEITTTTTIEPGKSYADAVAHPSPSGSTSRRASFSQQAQQLIPNVSKQQLAYGLPIALALILSLLFLGFRHSISSYFAPPPPPTLSQKFAHKLDSFGHNLGGDYWDALKHRTLHLHQSASELVDSLSVPNVPGLETLKLRAEELKAEAEKQYKAAEAKGREMGAKASVKAGLKTDQIKESGSDKVNRAGLHASDVAENVRHAVNEASEAVRHAAAETQEAIRHRAAEMANAAGHKVQDVKDGYHNIKQTIQNKL